LRDNRQVLAFGKEGQEKIRSLRVGIVGLGGLGSLITQQLAYLGVRDFILIDPDEIEEENLNRVVGAYPCDVGKAKVSIAERMIKQIVGNEHVSIKAFHSLLQKKDALQDLFSCDLIFGCVDRDGARLILNEIAVTLEIPYIDSAFGIFVKDEKIVEGGGRVILTQAGGPCLLCCKDIDREEASYDLSSKQERVLAIERGYITGSDIPDPSVIFLDGIVASLAVTEFLALVTGFREPNQYLQYDLLIGRVTQLKNRVVQGCEHHLMKNKEDILRYVI
jgi:molybdopterin/thiamine biosynthesis adenylyltransferase